MSFGPVTGRGLVRKSTYNNNVILLYYRTYNIFSVIKIL